MPLPTFKTLEEIPEAFRSEYVERDGEYVPNVEDVAPLKSAHERQKEENRKLRDKIAEIEKADKLKAETDKAKQQGVTDEQLAKIRAEIAAEKAPLEEANTKLQSELRSLKLDGKIKTLMVEAGFNPKRTEDLYKLIGDRFDLNDSGTPILKDNPAADLLKTLKTVADKEYPEFALSPQKGGTRAEGGGGAPAVTTDQMQMLVNNPGALLAQANAKTA